MRWTVTFDRATGDKLSVTETEGDICGLVCEPTLFILHVATQEEADKVSFKIHEDGRLELLGMEVEVEVEPEAEVEPKAEPEAAPEPMVE